MKQIEEDTTMKNPLELTELLNDILHDDEDYINIDNLIKNLEFEDYNTEEHF